MSRGVTAEEKIKLGIMKLNLNMLELAAKQGPPSLLRQPTDSYYTTTPLAVRDDDEPICMWPKDFGDCPRFTNVLSPS